MTSSPFLHVQALSKRFGALQVLRDVTLEVSAGEILALLGPSGSGKTTLLRTLAGFETEDSGRVTVGGEEVTRLPAARRRFGMVFQHYALFPHLTVGRNVAFGLEAQGAAREVGKDGVRCRVAEMLELVDLSGFEERKVGEISGGQQQRVALARALATRPRVLLLDEPLSNLDPSLRERTRRELEKAIRRVAITTVLVTHEQDEAFDLGDRVAVLHRGILQQVGTPRQLYEEPATRFVAAFVGRASALPAVVERTGEEGPVRIGERIGARIRVRIPLGIEGVGEESVRWPAVVGGGAAEDEHGDLLVRPEGLALTAPEADPTALPGRVVGRRFAGPVSYLQIALEGGPEVEVLAPFGAASPGDSVAVAPCPGGPAPRFFRKEKE